MWMTKTERKALAWIGGLAILGLGVMAWQQRQIPVVMSQELAPQVVEQWDARLEASRRIDINAADVAELERLPGVGSVLAERIIEYREAHGRFSASEGLLQVSGIGPKTYAALREYIRVR